MKSLAHNNYVTTFASWCAARAAQRGFAESSIIIEAIYKSQLPNFEFVLNKSNLDGKYYSNWHNEVNQEICKHLKKHTNIKNKVTYGRVAKIIAVYIKTAHILGNPKSKISKFAHPPIDRILLNNLAKKYPDLFKGKYLVWTKLNKRQYQSIIESLKEVQKREKMNYFWMMEKYWTIAE